MKFSAQTNPKNLKTLSSECLIIPVYSDKALSANVKVLDQALEGLLAGVTQRGDFSAEAGSSMLLPLITEECKTERILLLGFGKHSALSLSLIHI